MYYNIMPTILIVEKNANVKELTVKIYNEDELYKKAGFKTQEGFKVNATWDNIEVNDIKYSISLYGKVKGRAGQENKFEFPPPIDSTLFFGNCIIINKQDNIPTNITAKEWESVYEHLYGGFEEIGEEDSEDSEEDNESDPNVKRTKDGYVKDGFIVDEDEDDADDQSVEEDDDDEDEPEEFVNKTKKSKPVKSTPVKKASKKKESKKPVVKLQLVEDENYLDCTSELSEEEYFA